MLVLIGSRALSYHIQLDHSPRDIDLVGTFDDVLSFANKRGTIRECYPIQSGKKYIIKLTDGEIIEAEIAWPGSLAEELCEIVKSAYGTDGNRTGLTIDFQCLVPSLNVLYMLKMSHRYLRNSPHFLKTMRDIQLMRKHGATIWEEHEPFYNKRVKETYDYGHPNLAVKKDQFFTGDGVNYQYDHDTIHLAMAGFHQPAYKFYQPKDSEVNVSKRLFMQQPEPIKLAGVLEESYVLALERSQIPFPGKNTPKKSFDMALMKVCTSITSGWFREYSYESYDKVQSLYKDNYVVHFWNAVEDGIVKPYKG